jgi:TRAP-type uncharacterized transport system fused permease subunit
MRFVPSPSYLFVCRVGRFFVRIVVFVLVYLLRGGHIYSYFTNYIVYCILLACCAVCFWMLLQTEYDQVVDTFVFLQLRILSDDLLIAVRNKVRMVVDVCLLTCTIRLVHGIVTMIKYLHILLRASKSCFRHRQWPLPLHLPSFGSNACL